MAPPPKYTPGPVPPYAPPGQNPTYFPPQQTGNTFQTTDGFYGQGNNQPAGQQEAIPLQPPQNSYYPRGDAGAPDYAPPAGPPPGK